MKDILETIVKHLVENQDAVKITEATDSENEKIVKFTVNVAKETITRDIPLSLIKVKMQGLLELL